MIGKIISGSSFSGTVGYVMKEKSRILEAEGIVPPDAKRMAEDVRRSGKSVSLEPMNPYERRILHASLQDNPYVSTHSEGEEPFRHVVITAK